MKMVLAVGGPLHGRYLPDGPAALLTEAPFERVAGPADDVYATDLRAPRTVTYRRRMLAVRGWMVALDVYTTWPDDGAIPDGMVLPGHVTGVPLECEPLERDVRAEPGA